MDKRQLNQEIVLCRSVVKRAKVCVIRKLIKKIKILRACKNEKLREKKLKKARRLAAEIHEMKGLQPDYVTKFALITENYIPTGSNTKLKRKRNACGKLVKHKELIKKINAIKNKFSNWREELPLLLESAKKKDKVKDEDKNENDKISADFNDSNSEISPNVNADISEDAFDSEKDPLEATTNYEKNSQFMLKEEKSGKNDAKIKTGKLSKPPRLKVSELTTESTTESDKCTNYKKKGKKNISINSARQEVENKNKIEIIESDNADDVLPVENKVDDPFFINKKVAVPKLLLTDNEDVVHDENKDRKRMSNGNFETKPKLNFSEVTGKTVRKAKYEKGKPLSVDELHPSWKAKKIQMIKPFEGKKIKFE